MAKCGIYVLTNKKNGKQYIGQSIDIDRRLIEHSKHKESFAISAAVAKHGWEFFSVDVLVLCSPDDLNRLEVEWIAALGTLTPRGYNMTTGGGQGKTVSDDVRKKISENTRKGLTPDVVKARNVKLKGIPKSEAWKKAMSERQKNPENIARITQMARNMSEETKRRISEAKSGKKISEETRIKLSIAKHNDLENTARLAEFSRNRSAETRKKMSNSAKARPRARNEMGRFYVG